MNESKIKEFENIIEKDYTNTCGIVVMKDNKLIYENYYNKCDKENKIHIYSITKSIISILIGIAIDKGYIKNADENILNFFPDYKVQDNEKTIQNIKLKDIKSQNRPIIFLCIGTDRATGDSLGPLIGYKLKNLSQKNIYIYGSLEYPIHSVNLVEILNKIKCNFKNPFIGHSIITESFV